MTSRNTRSHSTDSDSSANFADYYWRGVAGSNMIIINTIDENDGEGKTKPKPNRAEKNFSLIKSQCLPQEQML